MKMNPRSIFFGLSAIALFVISIISSCSSKRTDPTPTTSGGTTTTPTTPTSFTDTVGPLKTYSDPLSFMTGLAITASYYPSEGSYTKIVNREADMVTFGNEMKYGSIVQGDGTYNFTTADALFNAVTTNGLKVYGHTLGWYQQQNPTYLNSLITTTTVSSTQLLPGNQDFENGLTNWQTYNAKNGATVTADTNPSDAHTGNGCMEVYNPVAQTFWYVQVAGPLVNTTVGIQYNFSYWVKASTAGGSISLSTADQNGNNAQYQGNQTIGTSWQQVNYTFTANSTQTRILFNMGLTADTYYIDDASFNQAASTADNAQTTAHKLDSVLGNWINAIVGRYEGKVIAWDVINELFADGTGAIRNNSNLPSGTTTSSPGVFVWSNYLGKNFGLNAFNYAHAADPSAKLFINDYNLESSTRKLDSLVAYVNWLKSKSAPIDGIGTQMHISVSTDTAAISNAFKQLASTNLLVRISELDVVINTGKVANFTPTTDQLTQQAKMYYWVVRSYIKNVPVSQRYGITVWGIHDPDSWITNDAPLLFDANYKKKSAYSGFVQALKAK